TDEIIFSAATVFLGLSDPCLMSYPTFTGVEASAKLVGARVIYSPLREMKVDGENIAILLEKKPKLRVLCNPNNPTGTIITTTERHQLIDIAHRNEVVTIVDEAYAEYADPEQFKSAVTLIDRYPNLLVTRTFSKAYGLAGLRCGYAMGNKQLI